MKVFTLENALKAVMIGMIFVGATAQARGGYTGFSEGTGYTRCGMGSTCPVGMVYNGRKKVAEALAAQDAADVCRNDGGIPLSRARILDSDCEKNFYNRTISCVARAAVRCGY